MKKLNVASIVIYTGLASLGVGTAIIMMVVILRSIIFGV